MNTHTNSSLPLLFSSARIFENASELPKRNPNGVYRILLLTEGKLQISLSRGRYTVRADEFLYLTSDVPFSFVGSTNERFRLLLLEYTTDDSEIFFPEKKGIYNMRHLPYELSKREEELLSAQKKHPKDASAALYSFLLFLRRNIRKSLDISLKINDARILPAVNEIKSHYAEELTLPALAALCGLSPQYFCRLFHELTSKTPVAYMTEVRMNAAAKLLSETDMTEARVASSVGYTNFNYFLRIFKRHFTLLPSEYRIQKNKLT